MPWGLVVVGEAWSGVANFVKARADLQLLPSRLDRSVKFRLLLVCRLKRIAGKTNA